MAKVKTEAETGSSSLSMDQIFGKLVAQHNTIAPDSAAYGEGAVGSEVTTWIPTGSVALDTIISNKEVGGWPCGRIVELYGEQAYGKSSLCFQGMARTQQMGGIALFFDVERAASPELMEAYGIDTERIVYSQLNLVEDIFDALEKNLTLIATSPAMKGKPVFVCIDSLAAMKSRKLVEGTYDYNMNTQGEFAKVLGLALKRSLDLLDKANACLVVINQLRDKIGVIGGDTKFTPGGNAMKFYASVRLRLLGRKLHCIKEPATGEEVGIAADVTVRTDKNKLGPPMRKVDFLLDFVNGVQEAEQLPSYLTNLGYITRGGSWYTWNNKIGIPSLDGKKFQASGFEEFLEDPKIHDAIMDVVRRGFILDVKNSARLEAEQNAAADVKE